MVDSGRRYGGRTSEERHAERRERLLDAALELFGTRGYADTTIEAICAASQLGPRYFYEQFGSREELLLATYERHMEAVTDAVRASVAQAPPDPVARLEAGLRAFVDAQLADERDRGQAVVTLGKPAGPDKRVDLILDETGVETQHVAAPLLEPGTYADDLEVIDLGAALVGELRIDECS